MTKRNDHEEAKSEPKEPKASKIGFDWRLKDIYDRALVYLLIIFLAVRVIWLPLPTDTSGRSSLVFDEKYYVNVARILLGLPHDPDVYPGAPLGIDPNKEHPPLAKLIIALSMAIFGDNAWGWRIPSVVFGMAAIFIFYLLMKRVSEDPKFAILTTFLLGFDNMVFVHSRIATLDIFVLTFMILGFYWYFENRMGLSAFALGLSTLCKIGGLYGFIAIVAYHFLRGVYKGKESQEKKATKRKTEREKMGEVDIWNSIFNRDNLSWFERYMIIYALTGLIILFILDRLWCGYANPIDHIIFIYKYTLGLQWTTGPAGIESYPWQWLLNQVPIPYLTVNIIEQPSGNIIGTSVAFVGAMNPLIIYLCVPTMAYVVYQYYLKGGNLHLFILTWFALTYLPFYPLSMVGHRISYIFYFLDTVPSVCMAIGLTLLDRRPPRIVIAMYLIAVFAGFLTMFPFKQIP